MTTASARLIDTLIVDDEPLARQVLRQLLSPDCELRIVGECTGVEALALIRKTRPALLFLDIQMPGVSGFDVLAALSPSELPVVVFVTAYDQYALRAFAVHATDYLLKPFDDARFAAALAHAKQQVRAKTRLPTEALASLRDETSSRGTRYKDRFLVRSGDQAVLIRSADIDWIEAADYYAQLHVGGTLHLIREPLSDLEQQLDPSQFYRIHRSAIVNLDRVVALRGYAQGHASVVLRDGQHLAVSRQRRDDFERLLGRVR